MCMDKSSDRLLGGCVMVPRRSLVQVGSVIEIGTTHIGDVHGVERW